LCAPPPGGEAGFGSPFGRRLGGCLDGEVEVDRFVHELEPIIGGVGERMLEPTNNGWARRRSTDPVRYQANARRT
jgi:hypothetical protein